MKKIENNAANLILLILQEMKIFGSWQFIEFYLSMFCFEYEN